MLHTFRSAIMMAGLVASPIAAMADQGVAPPTIGSTVVPRLWADEPRTPEAVLSLPEMARPAHGRELVIEPNAAREALSRVPVSGIDLNGGVLTGTRVDQSGVIIELPTPEGSVERFRIVECSIMHPDMQTKYADIRTYIGQGVDRPAATLAMDCSPLGVHAQVIGPGAVRGVDRAAALAADTYYIDPVSRGDNAHHVSYFHGELKGTYTLSCQTEGTPFVPAANAFAPRGPGPLNLRVLRLALAATGEYTAYHSLPNPPNQAAGLAAIATCVSRMNQVFMRDLGVQLVLAQNNDAIVFVDAASDPYMLSGGTDPSVARSEIIPQNPAVIATYIAAGAYDLGHVVHAVASPPGQTGAFAGRATVGGVCGPNARSAASCSQLPNGTYMWIALLSHEIGHQLGATHTFNGIHGSCGTPGEYTPSSAIEPGSGTTIMSYAGNCTDNTGSDDVVSHTIFPAGGGLPQAGTIPMFGAYNIDQVGQFLATVSCGVNVSTGNQRPFPPIISPGTWTIPANSPFRLACSAGDPDFGQQITVSWEQYNLGLPRALGPDTGANEPLFRTFEPGAASERIFPALSTVLGGAPLAGENLPRFNRSMFFRAVSRDNFAQGGGTNWSQATVNVVATPGNQSFAVTSPAAGATFCAGQILAVQWNPVGTADAPVNAPLVDITLSLDGGQTWPITLLAGVANSGQAIMPVPAVNTVQGRIKVEPTNNIFFAVNPGNISIAAGPPSIAVQPADLSTCPSPAPVSIAFTPGPNPGIVQWYRNGAAMAGRNSASLDFTSVASSDTGDYYATITNACGQVQTRTLRLQVGISFDNYPGSAAAITPCSPLTLSPQVRGVGPISYRWFKNNVSLADGNGISGATTPSLTFSGVRFEHEGVYSLLAQDSCGQKRSADWELKVAGPFWVQKGLTPAPGGTGQSADGWVLSYDEQRAVTVMYGGRTNTGAQANSLWEYDGSVWTPRVNSSNGVIVQPGQALFSGGPFPPRSYAATYSPDHRRTCIVCSNGFSGPLRVWSWDGTSWSTLADRAGSGDADALLLTAYDRARHRLSIIRVAGSGGPPEFLEFDPSTNTFTAGPTPPQPNGLLLGRARLYFDEARQKLILYQARANEFSFAAVYAFDGAWSTLSGVPIPLHPVAAAAYDPIRQTLSVLGNGESESVCGVWDTRTVSFPGSSARFSSQLPDGVDWGLALPDGPPRNPSAAGMSPDNPFSARMLAFDRRRRAMVAVGGRNNSSFSCGPTTWDSWERRYLDQVVFDVQPPATVLPQAQTLTLTATAAGAGTVSLRWLRNGVALSDGSLPGSPTTTVAGSGSGTLTIIGPGAAESATYTLRGTNACGAVTSGPVVVGTPRPADFNGDGVVSVQDIFDFLASWFAADLRADVNHDGTITVQDIFDFLAAWFGA